MTDATPAVRMPTDEMILAGAKAAQSAEAHHVSWKDAALSVWSAMEAATPVAPGEGDEVEIASKAYADATGYYVPFHRGLSSPSADQIRTGIRAALAALRARSEPEAGAVDGERQPSELELAIRELLWPYFESAKLGHFTHENDCSRAARQIAGALKPGFYLSRFLSAHPAPSDPSAALENAVVWHKAGDAKPEPGHKFVALYDDGSGAWLGFAHDGGFIDSDGDDYEKMKNAGWWAYLPTGYRLCCEDHPDAQFEVRLPEHVCPPLTATRATPASGPVEDDDRLAVAVEALSAEIKTMRDGTTIGAWDRGRLFGFEQILALLTSGEAK